MTAKDDALATIRDGYYGGAMEVDELIATVDSQIRRIHEQRPDAHANCDARIQGLRELVVRLDYVCDNTKFSEDEFRDRVTSIARELMDALPLPKE